MDIFYRKPDSSGILKPRLEPREHLHPDPSVLPRPTINQGVSERLIGDFLGHKTLKSTRRYAKVQIDTLEKVWGKQDKNL